MQLTLPQYTLQTGLCGGTCGVVIHHHRRRNLGVDPLLLSPIVGGFAYDETGRFFSPPQEHKLSKLAEAGQFPVPMNCEVHTGSEDWQSHPDAVAKFFGLLGVDAVIAEGRGHSLGDEYVSSVLVMWFAN